MRYAHPLAIPFVKSNIISFPVAPTSQASMILPRVWRQGAAVVYEALVGPGWRRASPLIT
jgi:hypothetical protein